MSDDAISVHCEHNQKNKNKIKWGVIHFIMENGLNSLYENTYFTYDEFFSTYEKDELIKGYWFRLKTEEEVEFIFHMSGGQWHINYISEKDNGQYDDFIKFVEDSAPTIDEIKENI